MKWYLKCLRQYADFKGRARRKEYWWFAVINFIISMLLLIPVMVKAFKIGMSGAEMDEMELFTSMLGSPILWIYIIYSTAVLIPGIAVCVRRLHDIGHSGWWAVLFFGISMLNGITNSFDESNKVLYLLFTLIILVVTIIALVWLFTDSQPGENQWGPNPKEPSMSETTGQPMT